MRILGIDYGDSRVGVAVSDLLGITAQGVRTIKNKNKKKLLSELSEIIEAFIYYQKSYFYFSKGFLNLLCKQSFRRN